MSDRKTGSVTFWHESKGYGFITPDSGGDDIFVHTSAVQRAGIGENLPEGAKVSYGTEPGRKPGKFQAVDIKMER